MKMSASTDQAIIARRIGYKFRDKKLLNQALTAAGAREDIHDGNRTLAQIGKAFIDLVSTKFGYTSGTNPGK